MKELLQFGTLLAFTVFVSFIVYNSVKYFRVAYKKNEFIENRMLKFIIALFFSLLYGFMALFGGSPMENDE